jgi:hypothetical protein
VATAHNDTVEPGQSSRSALLRKPDHAVASGLVQRKARDANGVADGAEHAVSAASLSSGSPLPDTLMRKFESSLGADLSGVRIHTGGASERAADAVGAKAYTMGNDIHFGAGHYDPSSPGGQHLLAHEVAHTVQQSGEPQRMQFQLEVSSPGDSLEHEADRAADAMVAGGPATAGVDGMAGGGVCRGVQRKPSVTAAPAVTGELAMVHSMIASGKKNENGLTNAVFHARHPDMAGKSLTKGSPQAKEWLAIRDEIVHPALSAPATSALATKAHATPSTTTTVAPSEPGLIEQGINAVTSIAESAYNTAAGWFSSNEEATPFKSGPEQTQETRPPTGKVSNTTRSPPTPGGAGIDTTAGEARFHTKTPTIEGSTLDVAKTRADKGDAGTTYSLGGAGLAESIMGGKEDATTFYCSGLSIWTLATAGYDVAKPIVGADSVPYTWTKSTIKKDKKTGQDVKKETEVQVTLKEIIDGEPRPVEAMAIAEHKGMKNGGSVGRINDKGHALGHTNDGDANAVKGAAGAFELAGIGSEVSELEQKPGDFAQSRRTTAGKDDDTEVKHRGAGHAWQVWSVRAQGSAIFGQKGSPKSTGVALEGWQENIEFIIDKDTLPSLVGTHKVLKATRIEANIAGAGNLAGSKAGGDGGVQITGESSVPDPGSKIYTGYVVYYGRLGTSPWNGWRPATKP